MAEASGYVGEGANRWAGVHVRDAARLFRLALEHGAAGASYHGVADEGVAFREIAQVIARRLNVTAAPATPAEATRRFSWLAPFVAADNPVSSAWTQAALGWTPTEPGLLVDIDRTAYFGG